jgi:ceramide glucosyltransferase
MKTLLLLATLILTSSLGEILSARAMRDIGHVSFRWRALRQTIGRAIRSRRLLAGVACLAVSFFSFLSLLSYADLSYVVPLTAVSYITNTLGAKLFLKERISAARWTGTLLVATGVAIISLGQPTEAALIAYSSRAWTGFIAPLSPSEVALAASSPLLFWPLFALRLALLICVVAALAYYVTALWGGWLWVRDRRRQRALGVNHTPPVTILIPVRGADRGADQNFASFCRQDYPEYQLVFGARDEDDPAVAVIQRLRADFPARRIELVISPAEIGHNAKVSNLQNMYARAAHDLLIIVDSDIRVGPDYLRRVVAPMQEARVGMVTCLYRGADAHTLAAVLEGLGHSATYAPEVVTARALEGIRFAFGSTILMRRALLEEIGGFRAVADYLADDFLLGHFTAAAGYQVVLSDYIVEHVSGEQTWRGLLRHQLRWARAIRISRPKGYAGLILTHGTATSLLLLAALNFSAFGWALLGATFTLRLFVAWRLGVVGLKDRLLARYLWLVPLRDLIGFGIWAAGLAGDKVQWRGTTFRILPGGKIKPVGES